MRHWQTTGSSNVTAKPEIFGNVADSIEISKTNPWLLTTVNSWKVSQAIAKMTNNELKMATWLPKPEIFISVTTTDMNVNELHGSSSAFACITLIL